MKNKLCLILAVLFLTALPACSEKEPSEDSTDDTVDVSESLDESKAEPDSEKETETETDTETDAAEPDQKVDTSYKIVNDDNAKYRVYSDHVELAQIKNQTEYVIPDTYKGLKLTTIADNALDAIEDKANFRLFGDGDSFARDYAIEHGCIFIEWYDGSFPDHYYPYNGDESVWGENDADDDSFLYAVDDDKLITDLVDGYLSNGKGDGELMKAVMYRVACASNFSNEYSDLLPECYVRTYTSSVVDDYDKYYIYTKECGSAPYYVMVRYGKLNSYEKISDYLKRIYEPYVWSRTFSNDFVDIAGYAFQEVCGGGVDGAYSDARYDMIVYKGAIYLTSSHSNVIRPEEGELYRSAELILSDGKWKFLNLYSANGFEIYDYKTYIPE